MSGKKRFFGLPLKSRAKFDLRYTVPGLKHGRGSIMLCECSLQAEPGNLGQVLYVL